VERGVHHKGVKKPWGIKAPGQSSEVVRWGTTNNPNRATPIAKIEFSTEEGGLKTRLGGRQGAGQKVAGEIQPRRECELPKKLPRRDKTSDQISHETPRGKEDNASVLTAKTGHVAAGEILQTEGKNYKKPRTKMD